MLETQYQKTALSRNLWQRNFAHQPENIKHGHIILRSAAPREEGVAGTGEAATSMTAVERKLLSLMEQEEESPSGRVFVAAALSTDR